MLQNRRLKAKERLELFSHRNSTNISISISLKKFQKRRERTIIFRSSGTVIYSTATVSVKLFIQIHFSYNLS